MTEKRKQRLLKKLNAITKEEVNRDYVLKENAMSYVGIQPIQPKIVNYDTTDVYAKVIIPEYLLRETQGDFTKLDNETIYKIINNQDVRNQLNHNMSYVLALNDYMKLKVDYDPKAMGYVLVGTIKVVRK